MLAGRTDEAELLHRFVRPRGQAQLVLGELTLQRGLVPADDAEAAEVELLLSLLSYLVLEVHQLVRRTHVAGEHLVTGAFALLIVNREEVAHRVPLCIVSLARRRFAILRRLCFPALLFDR